MNTQRYTRGSVWRKWDLHVHAPGTKLCDGYTPKDGRPDLEKFCKIIHNSDVAVLAITDYFSLDGYFAIKGKYDELYKDNKKLLLPNLELRLPVAVNRDGQEVNLHLIFSSALTRDDANKFLAYLKTSGTTGVNRSSVRCVDLKSKQDFDSATVSIEAINVAIGETFGEHAKIPAIRQKYLLVVTSAKGDGIRPGGSGIQRKNLLTDEIDKFSDAFFANAGSRDYFLGMDRLETNDLTAPKPVFDGSDAHSFDELQSRLGRQVATSGCQRNITWIKADPTYAGLLQTLIEPADRVAIQAIEPDKKEPYKVISKVRFSDTDDFPAEVFFNRNLNAIIGSRSSGKSALLAFIAHAVDPDETVRLQVEAYGFRDSREAGPAAGFSWADVSGVICEVEWESGEGTEGKVIYIPQNSLYTLSEQPDEITKKIAPALFRTYPTVKAVYDRSMSRVVASNIDIRNAVEDWFGLADRIEDREHEIKDLGDKTAITVERDRLQAEIDRIKVATSLTDDEVAEYQRVADLLDSKESRLKEVTVELDQLSPYVTSPAEAANAAIQPRTVKATVNVSPSTSELPESIAAHIEKIKDSAVTNIVAAVEKTLLDGVTALNAEHTKLTTEIASIKQDHTSLIAKHEANKELSVVVAEHKKQVASLENITKRERSRAKLIKDQGIAVTKIEQGITDRDAALSTLEGTFNAEERVLTDLRFGIEAGVPPDDVEHVSVGFSQRNVND